MDDLVEDLLGALRAGAVGPPHLDPDLNYAAAAPASLIVELILPPQSSLIGERLVETDLRNHPDIHVVTVKRRQLHYAEQKIRSLACGWATSFWPGSIGPSWNASPTGRISSSWRTFTIKFRTPERPGPPCGFFRA